MKRPRNADCGKVRRPVKRGKISEGIYGSTFLYVKFLVVWGLVMMLDFLVEFRFEYLWPFWLLMRSVYDSYKYQGLAFSVFFVCVAITSDVVFYLYIPVQWLFFAASTYVWVQYVWHTERGVCLPTISLWLLFVYIEASFRLRGFKSLPFHLDLCRPFAAHCIGYPMVTLGFGVKSYLSYRMRVRRQKDIQKENQFYTELLLQALPPELQKLEKEREREQEKDMLLKSVEEPEISNGIVGAQKKNTKAEVGGCKDIKKYMNSDVNDDEYIEAQASKQKNVNENDGDTNIYNNQSNQQSKPYIKSNGVANGVSRPAQRTSSSKDSGVTNKRNKNPSRDVSVSSTKDECLSRHENDVRRLKNEVQMTRSVEHELRAQINILVMGERSSRSEMTQLQQDNENLQNKLHNLVSSRQQDKINITQLEKKVADEKVKKQQLENALAAERKAVAAARKVEEAAACAAAAPRGSTAAAVAATARSGECTELCKAKRKELESEMKLLKRESKVCEEQRRNLERENQSLVQLKESQNDAEKLLVLLNTMQEKNTHLENSLSAENRLKQDLFSALGKANRQVQIQQELLTAKEQVVEELKGKMAQVLALMPSSAAATSLFSNPPFTSSMTPGGPQDLLVSSSLNPNATDYLPKVSSQ